MDNLPKHVAIIPDGNRRWAEAKGLMPHMGHIRGVKRFREISQAAFGFGVPYFTFWAASEDNLTKRSPVEVKFLAELMREELSNIDTGELIKKNIRFRMLGRGKDILKDAALSQLVEEIETKTRSCAEYNLTLLFGYDGKREMVEAIKKIRGTQWGYIDEEDVKKALFTRDLPPVDLVIRTGEQDKGCMHLSSGFMMWDTANAEFYSTRTLWPSFTEKKFVQALKAFASRQRRFGA